MKIKNIIKQVKSSKPYQEWEQKKTAKLTHIFNSMDNRKLGDWQLGHYNKKTDKITVFEVAEKVRKLPQDDVLKKSDSLDSLNINDVKIDFLDALEKAKEFKSNKYPKLITNKTIIILQNLNNKQLWNLTFVGQSLDVLNIKVNSKTGEIIEDSLKALFSFDKGKK